MRFHQFNGLNDKIYVTNRRDVEKCLGLKNKQTNKKTKNPKLLIF